MEIFASIVAYLLILMFLAWLFLKMFGKYFVGLAAFLTAIGLGALVAKYIKDKKAEAPAPAPAPRTGDTSNIVPFEDRADRRAE